MPEAPKPGQVTCAANRVKPSAQDRQSVLPPDERRAAMLIEIAGGIGCLEGQATAPEGEKAEKEVLAPSDDERLQRRGAVDRLEACEDDLVRIERILDQRIGGEIVPFRRIELGETLCIEAFNTRRGFEPLMFHKESPDHASDAGATRTQAGRGHAVRARNTREERREARAR